MHHINLTIFLNLPEGDHIMFRKTLISFVAAAALGVGVVAMTATAEAHHSHHRGHVSIGFGFYPFPGFGYPSYYYGYPYRYSHYRYRYSPYYDDYFDDCAYRRVKIRKWNRSHTHRITVYRKRLVCY
jgi:hypothetical protein